jgi:TolB-like protein
MAQAVFAVNNLAVLELLPNASVAESIRIEESRHLTDELRRQAVMNLPKGEYSVLTRDNIIALMPPDEKEAECLAESCAIEIGRAIGVEYITQGVIGRFGSRLTISVELYETMSGKLLSSIVFESDDIDGLLAAIRSDAKPLFHGILDSHPVVPAPIAVQPPNQAVSDMPAKPVAPVSGGGIGVPQWAGIGLAAAGIGMGIYGFLQNSQYNKLYKDYQGATESDTNAKWKKAEDASKRRNIGYIIGSALLAGGVAVYFVF